MWLESSTVRPCVAQLDDALAEHRVHQRVEARGRLVEQQQLDVGGERGDQRDLLPVALGVGARLLGRVELEALQELGAALLVEAAAQPAEQVDHLAAGEVRPQRHLAGHVGQAAVQPLHVAPGIAAEQPRHAGVGAQQAEQDADRGRLAGAVRAEQAVDLAGPHLEVEAVERLACRRTTCSASRSLPPRPWSTTAVRRSCPPRTMYTIVRRVRRERAGRPETGTPPAERRPGWQAD